ncbi:9305_t:CDS:1, partial [Ambispora leptoticha]
MDTHPNPSHASSKEDYRESHYRDSSDLLPLTLVSGGTGGGLAFNSNYAYLSPPFGRVIPRNQIMSRVMWFSTLVLFNLIYAGYKLIHHNDTSTTKDDKSYSIDFIFLIIIPLAFFLLYIFFVTVWTYLDLRNKDFEPTFTVLYYSPLMLFSLFFKEKKRVDVSEFHEVNFGAKWWRFGTSRVREGIVMTLYSLLLMSFVMSDLVGDAFDQPNGEVSQVFKDFVPAAFMLVVFFLGFVLSIWGIVEALVGESGVHGSGEGRKRLVGVLP